MRKADGPVPLNESWAVAKSLLSTLARAPDVAEALLRLRSALRRIVDSIWMLVVPRGAERLAAVKIWFKDGNRCRDYVILHRPRKSNGKKRTEGGWSVRSLADVAQAGDLDLRDREHATRLEAVLSAVGTRNLAGK